MKLRGRLNVKTHLSTLDALLRRAHRFHAKFKSTDEEVKEMLAGATEKTDELNDNLFGNKDWSEVEQAKVQQLLKEKSHLLEVTGVAPGKKAEGIVWLVYENVNGLKTNIVGNEKLAKLKVILDDLEADIFAFHEHRNNLKHKRNHRYGLNQLFFGGETMVRGIWGRNRHETNNKYLDKKSIEGGTGMVAFGEMASLINLGGSAMDALGLARWTVMEFRGEEGHVTKVLCGYVPCKNNKIDSGTSYQQQH